MEPVRLKKNKKRDQVHTPKLNEVRKCYKIQDFNRTLKKVSPESNTLPEIKLPGKPSQVPPKNDFLQKNNSIVCMTDPKVARKQVGNEPFEAPSIFRENKNIRSRKQIGSTRKKPRSNSDSKKSELEYQEKRKRREKKYDQKNFILQGERISNPKIESQNELQTHLSAKEVILKKENPKLILKKVRFDEVGSLDLDSKKNTPILANRVEVGLDSIKNKKMNRVKKLIQSQEFDEALQILNLWLEIEEEDLEAYYWFGKIALILKKKDVAKKYFKIMLQIRAEGQQISFSDSIRRVEGMVHLGKYDQALTEIEQLQVATSQQHQAVNKFKGLAYYHSGRHEDALESLELYLNMKDKAEDQEIYFVVAEIYLSFSMHKKALSFYQKCQYFADVDSQQLARKIQLCKDKSRGKEESQKITKDKFLTVPSLKPNNQNLQFESFLTENEFFDAYKALENVSKFKRESLLGKLPYEGRIKLFQGLKSKGCYHEAIDILTLMMSQRVTTFELQNRAALYFKVGEFEKCEKDIESYITVSENPESPENQLLPQLQSPRSSNIVYTLNGYLNKMKELEILSLTESEADAINMRRNHNLGQAVKLFESWNIEDSINTKALSSILQESTTSIVKSSKLSEMLYSDVFALRQIKNTFQIWEQQQFSLQSLESVADQTYDLIKLEKNDFSIIPLHLIIFTIRSSKTMSFLEINQAIERSIDDLCLKYPPSEKSISESQIKKFEVDYMQKPKVDLFQSIKLFRSFQEVYKQISILARKAEEEKELMDEKVKEVCFNANGFDYKSGLKLPTESTGIDGKTLKLERVYCRIIEKIFSKELSLKKKEFLEKIQLRDTSPAELFSNLSRKWEQTIDNILKEKLERQQHTACFVYDLMRAKCMFKNVADIDIACEMFIEEDRKGRLSIIEIDNRLSNKTKDVTLKVKFDEIVGEVQLALEFESIKNEFNHSLYELRRSPFGPFFASFMWLTGIADSEQKLIIKKDFKWKMERLDYLHKFVYGHKLEVRFEEFQDIIEQKFSGSLFLVDFSLSGSFIEGYLCSSKGEFIAKDSKDSLVLVKQKPLLGLRITLLKDSFAVRSNYFVNIRFIGSRNFISMTAEGLQVEHMEKSSQSSVFHIDLIGDRETYEAQVANARNTQKKVRKMINF